MEAQCERVNQDMLFLHLPIPQKSIWSEVSEEETEARKSDYIAIRLRYQLERQMVAKRAEFSPAILAVGRGLLDSNFSEYTGEKSSNV